MFFPPAFLQELRDRLRVSEVLGRYIQVKRKTADEYTALCPFHNEKTPSFTISDRKGFYHCFGCGAHGDVLKFVTEHTGKPFKNAVEELAQLAGVPLPKQDPQAVAREEKYAKLYEVCEAACQFFEANLLRSDAEYVRDYIKDRAISPEIQQRFRLGYAPENKTSLHQHLKAKGFADALMEEAGLIVGTEGNRPPVDRFYHRLIFPITNTRGKVIAFGGRTMGDHPAKYLNSPDTPLFDKGRQLYALEHAKDSAYKEGSMLVGEGYMDVIALHQAGFNSAVAPLGTAVTETQLQLLWKYVDIPTLCMDGDNAGQRAMLRAAERALPLLQPGKSLQFAAMPAGKDPDDVLKEQGKNAMKQLLENTQSLSGLLWQRHYLAADRSTPEQQAKAKQESLTSIKRIAHADVQKAYMDDFYARLRAHNANAGSSAGSGHTFAPSGQQVAGGVLRGNVSIPASRSAQDQVILDMLTLLQHAPAFFYENAEAQDALSRLEPAEPATQEKWQQLLGALEEESVQKTQHITLPKDPSNHVIELLWSYHHTRYLASTQAVLLEAAFGRNADAEQLEAIQNEQRRLNKLAESYRTHYEDAIDV